MTRCTATAAGRLITLAVLATLPACAPAPIAPSAPAYGAAGSAQLFEGLGPHARVVTTASPEAQRYFDQGLNWMYAFNHDEAVRAFTRAAEHDPDCAMAWWGIAYAQGPNYNDPIMTDARSNAAWEALDEALARRDGASPVERALIEALAHRYARPWPDDRTGLEQAFAEAMAEVWAEHPDDADVGTLYAEALMVRTPWKLYALDGAEKPDTPRIARLLERVLAIAPDHPGANHLYIHAIEPSRDKRRALAAAARLSDLVPASGHLVHMPSHIYVQVGMWERSIEQNHRALEADAAYRSRAPEQGVQHLYMVHNAHMLAYSAMMIGREAEAMAAARAMWANVPEDALRAVGPFFDRWMSSVYDVQKRFGRWDDILAEPAPPDYLPITKAIWHAHRSIALAAKKDFAGARREHEAFRAIKAGVPHDHLSGTDMSHRVLEVSDFFVRGEMALQQGDWDRAAELLEQAAAIEDTLTYGEPPQWLQPVRHTLGAVYLAAGRHADAERVYRDDLARWPDNGWSLYGLSRALAEQGRSEDALAATRAYERVWAGADEPTRTSCKCIPAI